MGTLTLTDEYGQTVQLAGIASPEDALGLIASDLVVGSSFLTYTDEFGNDTKIALSDLEDGRKALVVNLLGSTGSVGDPGDLVALFNSNL